MKCILLVTTNKMIIPLSQKVKTADMFNTPNWKSSSHARTASLLHHNCFLMELPLSNHILSRKSVFEQLHLTNQAVA